MVNTAPFLALGEACLALFLSRGTRQDAGGGDGAASTASDLGAVEDLDDTKWSQVDRTKRAAMLRKQKDELALRVRTRLGKVASVRCPFKK